MFYPFQRLLNILKTKLISSRYKKVCLTFFKYHKLRILIKQCSISMLRTSVPPVSLLIVLDRALVSKEIMIQLHQ